DPENPEYRRDWAGRSRSLANLCRRTGQPAEARQAYEAAVVVQRGLVGRFPGDADHRNQLANTLLNLAGLRGGDEPDDARRLLEEALRLQRENLAARPQDRLFRMEHALAQEVLGAVLWGHWRDERGAELFREAGETFRQLTQTPTNDGLGDSVGFCVKRNALCRAEQLADTGDLPGAELAYRATLVRGAVLPGFQLRDAASLAPAVR